MGYASAMAWVLVLVVAVITAVIFRTARLWVFYAGEDGR
jgi:multiple sugar transport system permease protein